MKPGDDQTKTNLKQDEAPQGTQAISQAASTTLPREISAEVRETEISFREPLDDIRLLQDVVNRKVSRQSGLGALSVGPYMMWHVDYVNGDAAQEVATFVPTRQELLLLAQDWADEAIDIGFYCFLCQLSDSDLMRKRDFAWRRVLMIAEVLGQQTVDEVIQEVIDGYGRRNSPRYWHAFLRGTDEERAAIQREVAEEVAREASLFPKTSGTQMPN